MGISPISQTHYSGCAFPAACPASRQKQSALVVGLEMKPCTPRLHLDALPSATRRALDAFKTMRFLGKQGWYLAGGTALALHAGHRQSVDLDFFCERGFRGALLERRLFGTGKWITRSRDDGTLYGEFAGAKVSFIAYPFFMPSKERVRYGTVLILTPPDIAAMKIIAISQRGRKRDFIDLYWYCAHEAPLDETIKKALAHYPGKEHNVSHFLKSLVYFDDADPDPMPRLFFKADWKTIKAFFRHEVPQIAKELLRLK